MLTRSLSANTVPPIITQVSDAMWFLALNSHFLLETDSSFLLEMERHTHCFLILHTWLWEKGPPEWASDSEKHLLGETLTLPLYPDEKTEARAEDICSIRWRAELNLITLCLPTKADSKEGSAINTVRPAQNYNTEYRAIKLRNREGNSCAVSQQLGLEQALFAGPGSKPCSTDTLILKSSSPRVIEILPSCRQMLWRLGRI